MAAVNSLLLQEKRERDAAYALESFARYLYADKPDLFDNFYQAKRLLELADRRFRAGGSESLFDACSQSDKEACWAFKLHPRINAVLNPRGMEMLPIHKDGFVFQTLENCSDILLGPKDLYSLCLCLWVLQQHRCIYKLVLDVSVVARYHSAAFWKLLRLNTKRLDAVELRGLVSTPDRFSLHPLLCGAVGLSELILVDFTLTPLVIEQLCDLLDRNKGVRVLALRNIVLDTTVGWLTGIPDSTGSEESDVGAEYASSEGSGESVAAPAGPVAGELSQEDTSASDTSSFSEECGDQDSVEADPESAGQATSTEPHGEVIRDWAPLFRRLEHYASLTELEISGRRAAVHSSLSDLASVLLTNVTLKRLTVQVCLPKGGLLADCLALAKAIGQNKGLESLSFASSNFGSDAKLAMDALRAALEENVTLLKLSMADCGLSCSDMLLLVGCLERNTTLEELHIDAFHDQDLLRKLHDTCKLDRVEFFHKPACGDVRRRRALEKGEPAGEMNFLFTRTEDFEPMFAVLSGRCEDVHDLSIEGNVPITEKAAQLLANIILKCSVLESVTLLFPARALPVVIMLEALGASDTLTSLVVGGGWQLTDRAAHAFDRMLRSNTSLTELTVVQPNRTGFEDLKRHLRLGMQKNALVTKLRLLYDLDRKEARDYEIMRMLQRNRIVEKRLADMAARVRGDAGSLSATPNFDVEYYTTRLGLTSANPDFAGLQAKLEMSKKLRQEVADLTGRFSKMLSK